MTNNHHPYRIKTLQVHAGQVSAPGTNARAGQAPVGVLRT